MLPGSLQQHVIEALSGIKSQERRLRLGARNGGQIVEIARIIVES